MADDTPPESATIPETIADIPLIILIVFLSVGVGAFILHFSPPGDLTIEYLPAILNRLTTVPAPDTIFPPYAPLWMHIYDVYLLRILPLTIFTLLFSVFLTLCKDTLTSQESIRYLLHTTIASFLSLTWWWFAIIGFKLINELTTYITPTDTAYLGTGLVTPPHMALASLTDVLMFISLSMYYFRDVLYYTVLLTTPVLIALSLSSRTYTEFIARRAHMLAGLLLMLVTLPVTTSVLLTLSQHLQSVSIWTTTPTTQVGSNSWWFGIAFVLVFSIILPIVISYSYLRLST